MPDLHQVGGVRHDLIDRLVSSRDLIKERIGLPLPVTT